MTKLKSIAHKNDVEALNISNMVKDSNYIIIITVDKRYILKYFLVGIELNKRVRKSIIFSIHLRYLIYYSFTNLYKIFSF